MCGRPSGPDPNAEAKRQEAARKKAEAEAAAKQAEQLAALQGNKQKQAAAGDFASTGAAGVTGAPQGLLKKVV